MNVRAMGVAAALVLVAACRTSGTAQAPAGTQEPTASGAPAAGQEPLMEPGPEIKGHASDQIVAGEILDVTGSTVTIDSGLGVARVLHVVPQTSITVRGQQATVAELREGQPVRASFNEVQGRDVAVEIAVAAAGAAGEPASPPITDPARPPQPMSPPDVGPAYPPGGGTGAGSSGDVAPGSETGSSGTSGDVGPAYPPGTGSSGEVSGPGTGSSGGAGDAGPAYPPSGEVGPGEQRRR